MLNKACTEQGSYLLESLINVEYGLGLMDDNPHAALKELVSSQLRLDAAEQVDNAPMLDTRQIRQEIAAAREGFRKAELSTASDHMVKASRLLQSMIPESIADCACGKKENSGI